MGRRFWESRQFYSAYIALFVSITNWITIQYKLFLEGISALTPIFDFWVFMIVAPVLFAIVCVLGGHFIHRKRQFRLEQSLAIEENPYLYKAAPGKERDLMIPIIVLQLETLEELLRSNNALSDEKRKRFEQYRNILLRLKKGESVIRE